VTAYETVFHKYEMQEGDMSTPEAKRDDVEELIAEYKPDTKMAFVDNGGNGSYKQVTGHAEWGDANLKTVDYLLALLERTDVKQVSVIITADFLVSGTIDE
jgi:hypothetical protein